MQTHFTCSFAPAPLGILDLRATLLPAEHGWQPVSPAADSPFPARLNLPSLSYLLLADRLAELYATIFPDRPEWLEENINWPNDEAAVAAAERFLQRVGALFPIYEEIWDLDLEFVDGRLEVIPIIPHGFDEWHDDWLDLGEPATFLLYALYGREETMPGREGFEELYPDLPLPLDISFMKLVGPLRQLDLPAPLDALPDLILMLHQATGNVWLDVGEMALAEGGGYPLWTAENVVWLADEWRLAEPIFDRVQTLLRWQNDNGSEIPDKLAAVHKALLDAHVRLPAAEPKENDA